MEKVWNRSGGVEQKGGQGQGTKQRDGKFWRQEEVCTVFTSRLMNETDVDRQIKRRKRRVK